MDVIAFRDGSYRYIRAGFQFSSGVAAEPGFEIERARLARPLPLAAGLAAVEAHIASIGRPSTAFAACELRSPQPFSERGFDDFNREYVKTLARWGIFRNDVNPVARTNVCPLYDKPREPALYAFSYTVPTRSKRGSFIVAGGAEARGGVENYAQRTVRYGDTSPDGMRDKVRFVVDLMAARLAALGFSWQDAISTQAYTVHDIGALIGPEIAGRGAAPGGVSWFLAAPPVVGLEFEMDVRGAAREIVLQIVELACHPDTPSRAVTGIAVHATRTAEGKLALHYSISGQIARLRVPPPGPARIGWKLWRHTCCELFVREKDGTAYHEFNFSPSGEWTTYAFSKYREGGPLADESMSPQIAVQSGPGRLDLYALADLPRLAESYRKASLAIGLASVIEEDSGAISYWALCHATGKPDFHHASAFALELE